MIKVTALNIEAYHCYNVHRQYYQSMFCTGELVGLRTYQHSCTDFNKDYDTVSRSVRCFGKIANGIYCVSHSCLYVCLQGVIRLPLDRCLSNLIIFLESLETIQVSLNLSMRNISEKIYDNISFNS